MISCGVEISMAGGVEETKNVATSMYFFFFFFLFLSFF